MGELRSSTDEFFDVAERIIQNINAVFDRDDSLDEFDIVPVESQSNRSPVIHVNHKLALESWCVPFLYSHSFACFTQVLPKKRNSFNNKHRHFHQHNNGNANYSSCVNYNNSLSSPSPPPSCQHNSRKNSTYSLNYIQNLTERERLERKLHLSRILILLNPDLTLAWNFRREAFKQSLTKFQQEISLVSLTSSRKPKCSDAFSYRKWLLKNILNNEAQPWNPESLYQIFENEIQAVEIAAAKYFSNYHAWNYRLWLLQTFCSLPPPSSSSSSQDVPELRCKVLEAEKSLSEKWIHNHVSDYSGFHYRQRLLVEVCKFEEDKEDKNKDDTTISSPAEKNIDEEFICNTKSSTLQRIINIFRNELDTNTDLIKRFPGHETLWYHRRFILQFIIPKLMKEKVSEKVAGANQQQQHNKMETDEEENNVHKEEFNLWSSIEEINCTIKKEEDLVKTIFLVNTPLLQEKENLQFITKDSSRVNLWYAEKHAKWLCMIFQWKILT